MPAKEPRTKEGDATHDWEPKRFWKGMTVEACAKCGIVRSASKVHRPCQGVVRVALRSNPDSHA